MRNIFFTLCLLGSLPAHAQPTFTPFHASGIYDLGEKAGWTVTLPKGATGPKHYHYVITKNNLDVIRSGNLDLSSGKAKIETTLDTPAMLYVEVTAHKGRTANTKRTPANGGNTAIHLGAAVAPWKLQPSVPRPADFDAFWDGKLKALAQVPINPLATPTETTRPGVEFYTVKLDSVGTNVRGYLAKPAGEGKFPALVIFQFAGVYALRPETAIDRAAEGWLAFDVDAHDIPPSADSGVNLDYQAIGNTDRETSYFLYMYLRDTRAIDYIASRPDWDGKTIVALGTSMGGQQSLVTAALNPRITTVIVNEPAGADTNGDLHGRKAGFPNWPSNNPKAMEAALYFDTVNFAPRIKVPVVAALGFIDTIAPPVGIWIAVNQVAGPKEVIPMIDSDHNYVTPQNQSAWESRSNEILRQILMTGEFQTQPLRP